MYCDPMGPALRCTSLGIEGSQSRQSTKLFLQSSELGLPSPHTQASVYPPPPLWFGEAVTLAYGREGGRSKFRRGDRHCGTLDINVLCGRPLGRIRYSYVLWVFVQRFTYLVKIESWAWNDYWRRKLNLCYQIKTLGRWVAELVVRLLA